MTDERQTMLNSEAMGLKFFLNGFPKAGLHLLDLLMRPLAQPMIDDALWNTPWVGMFKQHSWSNERHATRHICYRLGRVQPGRFQKGHLGFDSTMASFMYNLGVVHVFIYRDLRDVAVSQVYHILDNSVAEDSGLAQFAHPGSARLQMMGGFDEILSAVIAGFDQFPGILDRWEQYQPWLEQTESSRVHCVKFEDVMEDPIMTSMNIIKYMFTRLFESTGGEATNVPYEEIAGDMWRFAQRTDLSPTFREGRVGGWREHFKPFHIAQFQALDQSDLLAGLGYYW